MNNYSIPKIPLLSSVICFSKMPSMSRPFMLPKLWIKFASNSILNFLTALKPRPRLRRKQIIGTMRRTGLTGLIPLWLMITSARPVFMSRSFHRSGFPSTSRAGTSSSQPSSGFSALSKESDRHKLSSLTRRWPIYCISKSLRNQIVSLT